MGLLAWTQKLTAYIFPIFGSPIEAELIYMGDCGFRDMVIGGSGRS